MKKRYLTALVALAAGAAAALMTGITGENILLTLLRPFTLLGRMIREWSLSGAGGNAAAWAAVAVLSLAPVVYILIARRKRKQKSDWVFVLTGAGVFGGLFFLVNPTLYVHPALTEVFAESPEALTGGPAFMMLSSLLCAAVVRWTGGLMIPKKQNRRLIFWTQALMIGSMALIAFSVGFGLAESVQAVWGGGEAASAGGWLVYDEAGGLLEADDALVQSLFAPYSGKADSSALIGLLLAVIALIPDLFSIYMLDAAVSLAGAMERGFFSDETDECASKLAVRARYTLIASVGCMAAANIFTVLLAQWIQNWNMNFSLPLDELLISCGAMLLARLLSAACKVKRDNDLMI